jgi:hypothetical protein
VDVRRHPDVVVDQEHRIACRPVDADVALHCQPARRRMDVIELQTGLRAEALDLGARRRLVARVHDAELRRKHRLREQAPHSVLQVVVPIARRDDETRAGSPCLRVVRHRFKEPETSG